MPTQAEPAVAIGADKVYLCLASAIRNLEGNMETVCITAGRARIDFSFRLDVANLILGSHIHWKLLQG
ncbi:MAG: hypothetical protein JRF02_07265 [Deltaproteobacteria bacterium]|nr:hypothetical protein [Deltaproteobacteria bacterium]